MYFAKDSILMLRLRYINQIAVLDSHDKHYVGPTHSWLLQADRTSCMLVLVYLEQACNEQTHMVHAHGSDTLMMCQGAGGDVPGQGSAHWVLARQH